MDTSKIRAKFGDDYTATGQTFMMGIDQRFTRHMARRFAGKRVLETCTGAGFTTIALAREAAHVVTVEINPAHQEQARQNIARAKLEGQVTFVLGDVLEAGILRRCPSFDAAFLDPDWAVSGPGHLFRFRQSNTRPPADQLLDRVLELTSDVALVLPPLVDPREFVGLPPHELQRLYLDGVHELYCLYFGGLVHSMGTTNLHG